MWLWLNLGPHLMMWLHKHIAQTRSSDDVRPVAVPLCANGRENIQSLAENRILTYGLTSYHARKPSEFARKTCTAQCAASTD